MDKIVPFPVFNVDRVSPGENFTTANARNDWGLAESLIILVAEWETISN